MVTNYSIPPHPLLQPLVDNYILTTSHGKIITIKSNWPASNETSLIFSLSDQPLHFRDGDGQTGSPLQDKRGCIVGLLSHCNGVVSFSGVYHTFIIQFKANGFYKLFGLPPSGLVDKLHYADDVFGNYACNLNQALQNETNIQQMAMLADVFLLHFFHKQKKYSCAYDGISFISNHLFSHSPLLTVEEYALKANMSVRNFGRRFLEQTGVSPKFYCRLLRFNNAVNTKLKYPQMTFTAIAHDCGYFDQMHMIKDFKLFANQNPAEFFQKRNMAATPPIDISDKITGDLSVLDHSVAGEQFVTVKRNNF